MEKPLLTIFLLCHNSERFLEKTLKSILGQTYSNFELILSDNYSEDKTPEIIKSFQKNNENIIYCRNEKPELSDQDYIGCYSNYNACIKSNLIKGNFVAFCHDDDIYNKNIFEKEINFLINNPEAGAVFTMANKINREDNLVGSFKLPKDLKGKRVYNFADIFKSLLYYGNNFLITPTFFARTNVLKDVGLFNENKFRTSADLEMWLKILEKYPIGIINEKLINYRVGRGGKIYQRSRTKRSDYFLVMDHYFKKAKTSLKIEDKFLRQYEYQKYFDDTLLAMNFLTKNQIEEAKKMINKPFSPNISRAFFENISLLRIKVFILKLIMLICINIGLGRYLGRLYQFFH